MYMNKLLSKQSQKETTALLLKKYRLQKNQTLAEGSSVVREALLSKWHVTKVLAREDWLKSKEVDEFFPLFSKRGVQFEVITEEFSKKISDLSSPPSLFAIVSPPQQTIEQTTSMILALDQISDPTNLGAISRTACFYGLNEIWLSENCVDKLHPKAIRSSMGGIFFLNILQKFSLINELKKRQVAGTTIIVTNANQGVEHIPNTIIENCIIVLGSEAHGVSKSILDIADYKWCIQPIGRNLSLNVATTAAILLDRIHKRLI